MQHRKIRLPSESPLGDRTLVLLHLTGCILEIFCCNLVDWLASEYLGESLVDPVLVFCASGRVPAIQTVELFSKVRMTLEYKRLKNHLNTAYVTFSPLEKRMIVFSDFLKKESVKEMAESKKIPTPKGLKLQLLPSLTSPKMQEK